MNKVLGGFGQITCTSKKPSCFECPVKEVCKAKENGYRRGLKKVNVSSEGTEKVKQVLVKLESRGVLVV